MMDRHFIYREIYIKALVSLAAMLAVGLAARAQEFKIKNFRPLPNDVSAFITPVYDLNGDPCALIKIVAPEDFAFSSPLGIVKRKDEVGEIWLYLPRGSKMLTIKHPVWGVMRDYRFPTPLEGHVTYELTISTPAVQPAVTKSDTIVLTKTVIDTVTVKRRRPRLPWAFHAMFTVSLHNNGPSWGVMLTAMRRVGIFLHAQSDLRSIGHTTAVCEKDGTIAGSGIKPYYTGGTRHSAYMITAGPVHRLCRWLNVFYGVGYGSMRTAWRLAESEGGGYALNDGLSRKGIAGEAGAILTFGRISLSASAATVAGKKWQGTVGIGIKIGKQ